MTTALDYLASCTHDDVDWVEILRMRAAGIATADIDAWIRQQRGTATNDKHENLGHPQ